MATAKIVDAAGADKGTFELNDAVFGVEMSPIVIHQVVVALQNATRQGNAETKTRAEVSGGGIKPFRQKGTGRARQGSSREPHMRGGGSVWGPHKRSYTQKVPQAFRRRALCCALSERVRGDALRVLDSLEVASPKTKPMAEMVSRVAPGGRKALLVTAGRDVNVMLSARNLANVSVRTADELNVLDVMKASQVVLVQDAVAKLEERLK